MVLFTLTDHEMNSVTMENKVGSYSRAKERKCIKYEHDFLELWTYGIHLQCILFHF